MSATGSTESEIEDRNERLRRLLASCALHDRSAFEQLYRLTSAKLYAVILRILDRDEWAQDCLQEAYIRIWNNADSYRPQLASPMTWLATIARNQALDLLRRNRRVVRESDTDKFPEEVDKELPALERLQNSQEGRRVHDCLMALKSDQRQVIALAYFKGLTHDELATRTEIPLGTIKTWIRRGLEQLKRCLQ